MSSVNKVILVGRVGNDPTVRYLPNGDAVANVSLATSEKWKDKEGNNKEVTEWHRIVFWQELAEVVEKYVKKGTMLFVAGRIETKKWQDKEGNDRYTTDIKANELRLLSGKQENKEQHKNDSGGKGSVIDMDDDLSF